MRRQFLAWMTLSGSCQAVVQLLVQMTQLVLQEFDLLLLSVDGAIEFFQQVLGERDPGLDFGKAWFLHRRLSVQDQPGSTARRLMIDVKASTGYTSGTITSSTRVNTPTSCGLALNSTW